MYWLVRFVLTNTDNFYGTNGRILYKLDTGITYASRYLTKNKQFNIKLLETSNRLTINCMRVAGWCLNPDVGDNTAVGNNTAIGSSFNQLIVTKRLTSTTVQYCMGGSTVRSIEMCPLYLHVQYYAAPYKSRVSYTIDNGQYCVYRIVLEYGANCTSIEYDDGPYYTIWLATDAHTYRIRPAGSFTYSKDNILPAGCTVELIASDAGVRGDGDSDDELIARLATGVVS